MGWIRTIVGDLTTLSVLVSLVTYYLAANKTWQVKHERPVAASISIASYGVYLVTTIFFAANMLLTSAPWQTMAETAFSLVNTVFLLAVGLSLWVPGERSKGLRRLLSESLRSERRHLGALAKALAHPSGSRRVVDILTQIAVIDGTPDDREKAFVQVFAGAWGIHIDWHEVQRRGAAPAQQRFAELRRDVEAYLGLAPPEEQALQLAELIGLLVHSDETVTDSEALISGELRALLQRYGGKGDRSVYEVHLVPRSPAQEEAMKVQFPDLKRRVLPSGPVAVAATCYSPEYAEVVRRQCDPSIYAAVTRVEKGEP